MTEKLNHYIYIPQLIGIETNVKKFQWGFGKCDISSSEEEFRHCKIRIYMEEKSDRAVFDKVDMSRYNREFRHFRASDSECSVMFDQTVKGAIHLRYVLTVKENEIFLTVGKTYLRLIQTKLMYVHPIPYILFDLAALLLLKNGMTTLYCSAVKMKNNRTIVFMAPPNTGKSLCALKLSKDHGARIIAEDMAITDGEKIWGSSHTNLYRDYHDRTLTENIDEVNCDAADSVDYFCFLQKGGQPKMQKLDDYMERMTLLNHYSLGYYYSPCVRVFNYFYDGFSTRNAEEEEQRILGRLRSNARGVMIEEPDPMLFSEKIQACID